MATHKGVEQYMNVLTGKNETPEETLTAIDNMMANGLYDHALLYIEALLILAEQENDRTLIQALNRRKSQINFPLKFNVYKPDGAADENNTRPEERIMLPTDTPIIFKPNLNPDKIYEDLFTIKKNEEYVSGIPFWFVVHNFFENIDWLEVKMDTKFIAWVRHCFGWEWEREDFKRINSRFKKHFEKWPEVNKTDKNYCALSSKLRNTYQRPKPDGNWEDKDIYYKKGRIRYN
jgi:hypothetical protein